MCHTLHKSFSIWVEIGTDCHDSIGNIKNPRLSQEGAIF